jgi:dinuclear metal center YbgI/SA1388 family protein
MVALEDFCHYTDTLLNSKNIVDFCPNGLQVQGKKDIRAIATAVTASLATIERAVEANVQLLLVHHGLFWQRDPYEVIGIKRKKLQLLLQNNISLVAYHLPLDAHPLYGNNWKAAKALKWKNLEPFSLVQGTAIGVKGTFSKRSRETLKEQLENYYQHPAAVAFGGADQVSSGAIVSGGAYKTLSEAASLSLDCFVTGNYDEPAWHIAFEDKINFFALGHSATERIGPQALGKHLAHHFKLDYLFIEDDNPF